MKCVILAGGRGTRLSEETYKKPKPMVEIGGKPVLWHIMKMYSHFGVNDFIVCLGYKGYVIKEYFANYFLHMCDVTFEMQNNRMQVHHRYVEPWRVTLVETGEGTLTGGRLKRIRDYVGGETFCFTYGDGVSDISLDDLVHFHHSHGKLATLTAVRPKGRYGSLDLNDTHVRSFKEKVEGDGSWINGGFFVLEPAVFGYIEGDATSWETTPLERLAHEKQLMAYPHRGFWQSMDTVREKDLLEEMWQNGTAPWRVWQ